MDPVMSMQPMPWPGAPAETARIAKRAFPKGALPIRVRDELGEWCADEQFATAYPVRGAPGISPAQLAVVTVLQFTENLTDRQAADAVRGRLDWKYCLGLPLDDEGFDFSVLSEFRARLLAAGLETAIFEALLTRLIEQGLLHAHGRQRTDATHVLAAIRSMNRLELAGESIRAALESLAAAAPDWLTGVIDPAWVERYGDRIDSWRLPASQSKRTALALQYGRDGYRLLDAVAAASAPEWLRRLPAIEALRRIWIQQYYRRIDASGEQVIRRESEHGLPPGRLTLHSPYDLDARYSKKHDTGWVGYKIHLTETCHPCAPDGGLAAPNLITDVATTAATVPDQAMTDSIHHRLTARGLNPDEHTVDSGYMSVELLLAARARGITLLGPLRGDTSAQARTGGYTTADFTIDWDHQQVICPQGERSSSWTPCTQDRRPGIVIRFALTTCRSCPVRDRCTTATRHRGRQLTLNPRAIHETLIAARAEQTTDDWRERYKTRAGIEGTVAQATHATGVRHARYTGLAKTRLEHALAATALNLLRLDAWWTGRPLDRTRTSHLRRLDLDLAA
jgi:transposase